MAGKSWRGRAALGLAVLAAAATVGVGSGIATAGAVITPTVTVSPSTGLVDGQTVTVTGTGWVWAEFVAFSAGFDPITFEILECANTAVAAEELLDAAYCYATPSSFFPDSSYAPSDWDAEVQIVTEFTDAYGGLVSCAAPGSCVLVAKAAWLEAPGYTGVYAYGQPISFGSVGPPVPTTKDQCKNAGWKALADDAGTPFTNQGACVSYVATKGKNKA